MEVPASVIDSVLMKSEDMPEDSLPIKGYDFSNSRLDLHSLLTSYTTTGFQATHFGQAVTEIGRMLDKKCQPVPEDALKPHLDEPGDRPVDNCTLFLGYTSNLISSGIRETIRYLVQNNMVDCLVTSAGGIEEDFIKCMGHMYVGDFKLKGSVLRNKGINRTGNLLVPNSNYCKFEEWLMPLLDRMLEEQRSQNKIWTPSTIIAELGKEINNPESVYYWAYKNNIPVFCPALTDGSLGDVIYFHSFKNPGLIVDIVQDIRKINMISVKAVNTGMIILGGGVIKHHICNANLMRNGADFAVYVNTGQEFDGSDAGATPDEAVSWGKIKQTAHPVKVYADATLVFPLLVAETFARHNGDNKHSPGPKRKKRHIERHIDTSDVKSTSSSCDDYVIPNSDTTVNTSCDTARCTANDMDGKAIAESCDKSSNHDNVGDTKDDVNCDSNGDTNANKDGDRTNTDGYVNEAEIQES